MGLAGSGRRKSLGLGHLLPLHDWPRCPYEVCGQDRQWTEEGARRPGYWSGRNSEGAKAPAQAEFSERHRKQRLEPPSTCRGPQDCFNFIFNKKNKICLESS